MIYLLFHILFASSFTLLIKWTQQRQREDVVTVGAINYIVAALIMIPVFLTQNPAPVSSAAIWTGASMGATYFIAYFFVIFAIRTVGASSATVVSVLSILLPISLASILWSEYPSRGQSIGIAMALVSLVLITSGKKPADAVRGPVGEGLDLKPAADPTVRPPWLVPVVLVTFFLLCGMNRVFQDTFKHLSSGEHRPAFLLSTFTVSAIPSALVLLRNRRWPTIHEWLIGVGMALFNVTQTFLVLRALENLEGHIVFTLASCGAIVLTTLISVWLMGERISRRAQVGISMAVVALVLLRWLPG